MQSNRATRSRSARRTSAEDATENSSGRVSCKNPLRETLAFSRSQFSRLLSVSERTLASVESGGIPSETLSRSLSQIQRLVEGLDEVMLRKQIGPWLLQPNDAFGGLKPIEVIERGEIDRIWEMIFRLRSGVPS